MGHIRSYTISDSYVRFRRARGDAVLFSLGFDSFGLPAELEAIKRGLSPSVWVRECSTRMQVQFERLGYSCDWGRSFISSEPVHYRWSQWLFLALLERGLIYQRDAQVIWCGSCETVLAALQAKGNICWRCGGEVLLRQLPQWFLRVSSYVAENEEALSYLAGWNKAALGSQRAILGRADGFELEVDVVDHGRLNVFMCEREVLDRPGLVAISPNHPRIDSLRSDPEVAAALDRIRLAGRRRQDRASAEVVQTSVRVKLPGLCESLPLVISPHVDSRFGPTAVLEPADQAAPSRDNSTVKPCPAVRYRAQDFPISRQRSWGAPIPLVHCPRCGTVPVPLEHLPVELPEDLCRTGADNALARHETFVECVCPACGEPATRETDTLDCHVDALWMWMPICVPAEDRPQLMFDHPELRRWLPIKQIIWGADAGGYLFDQRMTAKFLQDSGELPPLEQREPFANALMHQMIKMDGRKMSKHLGNVVNPSELVAEVGADVVRLAVLAAASPAKAFNWNDQPLASAQQFLHALWGYAEPRLREWSAPESGIDSSDRLRRLLKRWCQTALEKTAAAYEQLEMQRAARNITLLFDRIQEFERRAIAQRDLLNEPDREAIVAALRLLLQAMAPMTPHIAEELWGATGKESMVSTELWPKL
jgi:leucyl-tRNA synthetase